MLHHTSRDGQRRRALAAEIIREHAAKQSAQSPTEDGDRDDRAGIGRDELVLRGVPAAGAARRGVATRSTCAAADDAAAFRAASESRR